MPILRLRLDRALDQRLDIEARREERTPARQAAYLLRRALGLPPQASEDGPDGPDDREDKGAAR